MKPIEVKNALDLKTITLGPAHTGSPLMNPIDSKSSFQTLYASAAINGTWNIIIKTSDQILNTNEQVVDNCLSIPLDANSLYAFSLSVYFTLSDIGRIGDVMYALYPPSLPIGCQFGKWDAYTFGNGYVFVQFGSILNYGIAGNAHWLIGEGGSPDFTLTAKAGSFILYSKVGEFV